MRLAQSEARCSALFGMALKSCSVKSYEFQTAEEAAAPKGLQRKEEKRTPPHKRKPRIIAVPPHEITARKKKWLSKTDVDCVHGNQCTQNGSVNVVPANRLICLPPIVHGADRDPGPHESVDMCHGS